MFRTGLEMGLVFEADSRRDAGVMVFEAAVLYAVVIVRL